MIWDITASTTQDAKGGHRVQYTVFITEKCCRDNRIKVKYTDSIMQSAYPEMEMMSKTITKITNENGQTNDCTLDYDTNICVLYMQGDQSSPVWRKLQGSAYNEIKLGKLATKEQSEIKRGAHQRRKEAVVEKGWEKGVEFSNVRMKCYYNKYVMNAL